MTPATTVWPADAYAAGRTVRAFAGGGGETWYEVLGDPRLKLKFPAESAPETEVLDCPAPVLDASPSVSVDDTDAGQPGGEEESPPTFATAPARSGQPCPGCGRGTLEQDPLAPRDPRQRACSACGYRVEISTAEALALIRGLTV